MGPIEGPWGVSLGIRPPHPPSSPPQVKAIIADLLSDDCRLLLAVRTTYRKLGAGLDQTHLVAWTEVLTHWATAMRAGYTLRATPEDRATFREHATWYVMKKSRVRNGITIWYDWQMYSNIANIFDRFGSLMLISQEGMEAIQHRMNMLLRLGHNFANVGRIPWRVLKAGRECIRAYMADRKKKQKTPAQYLWWKNFLSFASKNEDVLARVERYRKEGKTMDWKTEWTPELANFRCISTIYRILLARARFNQAFFEERDATMPSPGVTPPAPTTCEEGSGRRRLAPFPVRTIRFERVEEPVHKEQVGKKFCIKVYDARREQLVEELLAYYRPVKCQSEHTFADRPEYVQRKEIQAQRKERWAKRERSALWVAHPDRMEE